MDFVKVGEESDSSTILEIKGLFLLSKVGSQNPMTDFDETRGNFDFAIFYFFLIFFIDFETGFIFTFRISPYFHFRTLGTRCSGK